MDSFLRAAVPEPFTILGLRLRPFCIGYALLLQRFECEPVQNLDQLVRAVLICSRPVADAGQVLEEVTSLQLADWARKIGATKKAGKRAGGKAGTSFNAAEKIALFHDYISEHSHHGPKIVQEEELDLSDTPFLQHLKITLMSRLQYSAQEALELPFSLALWDYYSFWETRGRAEIVGERRTAMHDLANSMDQAIREAVAQGKN